MQRMDDARNTKKAYQASLHQQQPTGRCKAKWKGGVENDIRKIEIVNRRQVAQDRDGWRRATGETLILLG